MAIIQIPLNNFCTNNVCQSALNKALQDHINKENELMKKKQLFKRLMAYQKAMHLMNVANHSCSKDDLNDIFQRSKERFLNYFSNRLSEHTNRVLKDHFSNGIIMKLNTDLDYRVSLDIREDHNVDDIEGGDLSGFTSGLLLDAVLPKVNLDEFLSITFVPLVSDFINPKTSEGKVELAISPFSCANPKLGEQITGHELAHALSFLFMNLGRSEESFNKFLNVRNKCVNSFYQTPILKPGYPDFHKDDQFRSEEDMADLIQGLLYDDEKKLLLSCALLRYNPNTRKMDSSLENPNLDDPHTASFLRLLREAVYKDIHLPPSCQRIINENSNSYRFKKCTF